jgi:hypothetical protein
MHVDISERGERRRLALTPLSEEDARGVGGSFLA